MLCISQIQYVTIALRIRAEKDSSVNVLTANANGVSILKKLFVKVNWVLLVILFYGNDILNSDSKHL